MSTTVSDYDKRRRTRPVVSGVIAAGVATALVAVAAKAVRSLTRSRGPTVERARKKTGSSLSGRSNVRHSFKVVTYDGGVPTERSVTIQTLKRSSKSSKAERELPFLKLPISCTVHLVDEARDVEKLLIPILEKLEKDPHLHLFMGLDTEWTQGSKVALLQIEDGENCFLFRVLKIRQSLEAVGSTSNLPSSLCSLLQHQRVMFSGSAIRGDVGMMKAQFGVQIAHSIDLQDVCKRHAAIRGFVKAGGDGAGLRGLTRRFLKHDLSKDRRIRCGDWGVDEYSAGQLHYAAVDAVVGRLILLEMVRFAKDAAVESATKNSAHDDLISVSPVKVQRRPLAASHLPLPPREMWKWCTDLVMHGTDFEKLERREAKKKKVQAKLRAQKQKQKQKTNSWRPLLHPVLRLHDKKMRLAFATPGYSKKLLAKAKLQNVVDQLNLHVKSTRSSDGSAKPRALVRASAHDGSKVPTNCFLAAWHPLAPPADVTSLKKSKAKSSSQKQDDADVSKEGLDIAVNWLPAYDWRAGRPQCVFTAVDDLEGGESRECVPWVFSVKPKGKKKRQQHVEIPLPEGFCRILENAYSAGIGSVDLPRAVLSALLDTNKTDDEDNVSSNEQMATMRVLLFSILEQQSAHDEGTTEQAQPPCRLSLSPHGVVQLNKTTSLFRKTDRATRTALRLAPSHWYELEFPQPIEVGAYSFRATASAACRTNAPSSWVLQGHRMTAEEHRRAFAAALRLKSNTDSGNSSAPNTTNGWVTLHRVEGGVSVSVDTGRPLEKIEGVQEGGRTTGWQYDTAYKVGEVPGETRFFDVPQPTQDGTSDNKFVRLRWIFFAQPVHAHNNDAKKGEAKTPQENTSFDRPICSVQISSLGVYTPLKE